MDSCISSQQSTISNAVENLRHSDPAVNSPQQAIIIGSKEYESFLEEIKIIRSRSTKQFFCLDCWDIFYPYWKLNHEEKFGPSRLGLDSDTADASSSVPKKGHRLLAPADWNLMTE